MADGILKERVGVELGQVIAALRSSWWFPIGGVLLAATIALGVSLAQQPLYTSSTQLFVATRGTATVSDAVQGSQFSQQRVASYAVLLRGDDLASRVVDRLGLTSSPAALRDQISVSTVPETVLINVAVTDPSPTRAQQIAGALADEFTAVAAEIETPEDGGAPPVRVRVTETATLPAQASSPHTRQNSALAAVFGLFLGCVLAVLRVRLDRSVKSPDDVMDLTGVPVIGTILRDPTVEEKYTIDKFSDSRTAEDYRQLRANLQFLNVDNPPRVIMVTSAVPSEGKTTAVVNLALALVDAGRSVTVVEADLRKPKVSRYLGMVGGVGLTNILAGTADLSEVLQPRGDGALNVVASGPIPPNPGELLASSHMSLLLEDLRKANDFVLVDAPPLLPVADATGLAVYMDGVLISVRYGSTRKDQLRQAALTLERVGAKSLGVILNIVPPKAEVAGAYGYGYSYGYDKRAGDGPVVNE